ncbi:unnamed protein product [Durusdinium trenchii]|uniref:Uncharacterized protein n=1 Tax=Durusdinium trenchii TaxID=1381693 RepID=A0ABP0L5M0_9DINO
MCSLEPSFDSGESRASVQFAEAIDSNPHECRSAGAQQLLLGTEGTERSSQVTSHFERLPPFLPPGHSLELLFDGEDLQPGLLSAEASARARAGTCGGRSHRSHPCQDPAWMAKALLMSPSSTHTTCPKRSYVDGWNELK